MISTYLEKCAAGDKYSAVSSLSHERKFYVITKYQNAARAHGFAPQGATLNTTSTAATLTTDLSSLTCTHPHYGVLSWLYLIL